MNRRLKTKKQRRKISPEQLPLAGLMNILIILIIFLLKSSGIPQGYLNALPGMTLPVSTVQTIPQDALLLRIHPTAMVIENNLLYLNPNDWDPVNQRIIPLYDILMKSRGQTEVLLTTLQTKRKGQPLPFEGILSIEADQKTSYQTLRKVMLTGDAAGFKYFRMIAKKQESKI